MGIKEDSIHMARITSFSPVSLRDISPPLNPMEDVLRALNPWWEQTYSTPGILREKYLRVLQKELYKKKITFVLGLRRVGKTTLLKQLIGELAKKVGPTRILFVSLEHPAFYLPSLMDIADEFRKIHGISRDEKIYIFFDEVHFKEGFERDLKVLFDNQNVKIFASGSSASMLKDKKAFLTGRHFDVVVEPLDFSEFLLFKNASIKKSEGYLYEKFFDHHMRFGGMPEYVLSEDSEEITHLVNDIIYKDIIAKHGLKNVSEVNALFRLLCERSGKRATYNKLARILDITPDTVKTYISFFEDAFLVYTIEKHEKSLNARIKSPKKVYIADVGIRNVFTGFRDKGAVFENLVFLKIKERKPRYYFENGKEIDFVFENTALEAKLGQPTDEELEPLTKSKFKNKLLATDWKFFLSNPPFKE